MTTAPSLVVAGDPGVARILRETGRFPEVFNAASTMQLRELSSSRQVAPPATFLFAPGFTEDIPELPMAALANGLADSGFTVVVHGSFAKPGMSFAPQVQVTETKMNLSDLVGLLGSARPAARAAAQTSSGGWPARRQPSPSRTARAAKAPALPGKRGRVIAVASAKGGVGKTSTTVSLALQAAQLLHDAGRPGSCVIVDTNFQQADVARYLRLERPTILDLLRSPAGLSADTIRQHLAQVAGTDLYALLGPQDAIAADPGTINAQLYQRILPILRSTFGYVFIDTPVAELYHTTFADLVLPAADRILVPVEPNRVTLAAARTWLNAITAPRQARGGGIDPARISLILNRARMDVNCGPEEVMDLMPGWRFAGMLPENAAWTQAANDSKLTLLTREDPALESTLRRILYEVTADPVFEDPSARRGRRWKRLFGLAPAATV